MMKAKLASLASALLVAVAYSSGASAHSNFGQTLGAGFPAVDHFQVNCASSGSTVSKSFIAAVKANNASSAGVTLYVKKAGATTMARSTDNTYDAGDGPNVPPAPTGCTGTGCAISNHFSTPIINNAVGSGNTNGTWELFIVKSGGTGQAYDVAYHCMSAINGGGSEVGTTPTPNPTGVMYNE